MSQEKSIWANPLTIKEQVQIIKKLLPFVKPYKWYFTGAITCIGLVSVINVLLPRIIQNFMNHHLNQAKTTWQTLIFFAAIYFGVTVLKAISQFLQQYLYGVGSDYIEIDLRHKLYVHLHSLGMRYFDQNASGSLLSRMTNDTQAIFQIWQLFMLILMGFFAMLTAFIAMFATNHKIAIIMLIFVPILLLAIMYYQRLSTRIYGSIREKLSQLNAKLAESINGIKVIQNFRQEMRMEKEFGVVNDSYRAARVRMIKTESLLLNPLIDLFYGLGIAIVLLLFGVEAQTTVMAAGTIYAFVSYLETFYNPINEIMMQLAPFQDGSVASVRVMNILADTEYAPQQAKDAQGKITAGKIEFKHVTFGYTKEQPILKDLSFTAYPGQTIALVGHTGSGKSSTINALMRFYEFQSGEILLDGQPIRTIPMSELRQKMGLVLQESFMFYGDITSNIRMFNETISDEEVRQAAEFVQANRFIEKLPGQYHEPVTENGATFSAGEKQLLNFARTIVTKPKILILDEATANIDTETETLIQAALAKMRRNRTTIAIAHRLSTIQDADLILVLDQGVVVEQGTHRQLMALQGQYYKLYKLQGKGSD
ncbi:ATP-binding cassette subfamily B protein [Weissella beninensis]|uniref:ABC transporter ATP-binding protein n=1 Tax=Periweissella beninensis TaxID=504936 RepID=A0ABT0VI80_9LACO|nr:ABC transporter ATP-binding protein [Periweissella beninensis]MBM7543795.1 ATP-binding cassette subfamily B protein [Periweissella beninensis]MCM2436823.1 ABC transporter ATP-binding protein [Periweissella beninensis]